MVDTPIDGAGGDGVLLILGPTASGKSGLAIDIAEALNGVIVNADSMQVYRDLRLISARPSDAEMSRAPHRLFGFLDAAEICSAARWAKLAGEEIEAARRRGKLPIVVGGSGLYVRALTEGFSPIPDVGPLHRQRAQGMLKKMGAEKFHARLAEHDPDIAARLETGDSQRLIRAMEVYLATEKPLSWWQALPPEPPMLKLPAFRLVLLPERSTLYERCDRRFEEMVREGAVDEAMALGARGLDPDLPAMKALGVKQLIAAGRGQILLEQAVADAQTATRRYAKRQMTWLRHQIVADHVCDTQDMERLKADIFPKIREFRLTAS
ncbi:MAG: tRNA (adenosine(37)-N6)-dimethylallyltransferase MiaA [Minwuia sp.]|uniref:tRNA (adenosine(37)-N6)-dimethylallyltransferase MiaA n=1 Tax=Minwuia sp. TaxID=2493630 RepID=UPI003A8C631E